MKKKIKIKFVHLIVTTIVSVGNASFGQKYFSQNKENLFFMKTISSLN